MFYGANPLGALPLYADGINTCSVLFYRYAIAVVVLAVVMAVRRKPLAVSRRDLAIMALLLILLIIEYAHIRQRIERDRNPYGA